MLPRPGTATMAVEEQITALQYLRGLAASMVVMTHLLMRYERRGVLGDDFPHALMRMGEVGVMVFFAISGFIMVFTTTRASSQSMTGTRFFKSRLLRIIPLYYLTTVAMVAFSAVTQTGSVSGGFDVPSWLDWLLSALFIPYRNNAGLMQPIYTLGWSLNFEMMFYLLFAMSFIAQTRVQGIAAVICVLLLLATLGLVVEPPAERVGLQVLLAFYTSPALLYFVVGMAVGLMRRHWNRPAWLAATIPVQATLGSVAVAILIVSEGLGRLIVMVLAMMIVTLAGERGGHSRFAAFSRAFGDASYSIYLTHSFFLGAFAALTAPFVTGGALVLLIALAAAVAMCFAGGWLTWRYVELPITRRLRPGSSTSQTRVAP